MISRNQVRQFLAIVDSGNFTRAASQLNIAQPTLSAGISELERQLGTRLFIRERRRIRLTEAGNRLLPFARSIESNFNLAEDQVSSIPAPARPLRLGVLQSIPAAMLEAGLSAYAAPDKLTIIEGTVSDLVSAMRSGGIEIALTNLERFTDKFECLPILSERYFLAMPTGHHLAKRDEIAPSEVAGETMIARRACEHLGQTSQFFTGHGVRPRFSLRSDNEDRVMALVRAGIGVTVAPQSLSGPGIAMVPVEGLSLTRTIGFALAPNWEQRRETIEQLVSGFFGWRGYG